VRRCQRGERGATSQRSARPRRPSCQETPQAERSIKVIDRRIAEKKSQQEIATRSLQSIFNALYLERQRLADILANDVSAEFWHGSGKLIRPIVAPSSRAITASPSVRNDDALMRSAASTMAGKRSAQSWPLPVKQRTRGVPRAFGGHFAVPGLLGQYFDLVKIQSLASASVAKSPI
jgi:hypothetical protein